MKNLGTLENVKKIEKNISDGVYDFILTSEPVISDNQNIYKMITTEYLGDYSIIHVIDNQKEINWDEDGWHIWIVKYPPKGDLCNGIGVQFIQTATGKWGTDHHILTDYEINNLVHFFINTNYKVNKIG